MTPPLSAGGESKAAALLYRRVSTEEQRRTGYSLEDQLIECRKRAEELGATEIIDIVDDVGGDYLERPELQRAIELCQTGRVKWFICWDPDRFGRTLLTQQLAAEAICSAGTEIIFINHAYSQTDEGQMFFQMRGVIAEYEKKKILDRTARGKRAKLREGKMPGWFDPYGYLFNTKTDELEIDESQARWVRQIFSWATDPDPSRRLNPTQIAHQLNGLVDAPRGKYWYRSTVRGILHNPLYTGVLYWGKYSHKGVLQARRARVKRRPSPQPRPRNQWYELAVPAIVSQERWSLAQQYLTLDKKRRSSGQVYMLTGLVVCGLCGATAGIKRPKSGRYYCCNRRYPHARMPPERRADLQRCTLPHINVVRVETHVWQTVCRWVQDPRALERAIMEPGATGSLDTVRTELAQVEAELRENEEQQERLLSFVVKSRIRPEIADHQMQEITARGESLHRRKVELGQRLAAGEQDERRADQLIQNMGDLQVHLADLLESLTEERRHDLVRRLVSQVILAGKTEADWTVRPLLM